MPSEQQQLVPASAAEHSILKHHLQAFLQHRLPPKSLCPSEVARALTSTELSELGFDAWRDAMPAIRQLAWTWREQGLCEVLQRGEVLGEDIELDDIKGPIRIRRTAE